MSQITKTKARRKNAGTQTREIDTMLEIARLQEQVKLLTIENEHLRKYTVENPSTILRTLTPSPSHNNINETPKLNETKEKNLQNQSILRKSNKLTIRGCTCKGKCSSKLCGCVKKDAHCREGCKCNSDVCQNQEHKNKDQNKENLDHNELIDQDTGNQQILNKYLADVNAQKSLFTPDTPIQSPALDVEQFRLPSLCFGSSKSLTVCSDEEKKEEGEEGEKGKNEKLKKKPLKNIKSDQESVTQRKSRIKKSNLEVNNSKLMSTSNKEKRRQDDLERKNLAIQKHSSNEIEINKEIKEMTKRTNNYIQNIVNGMVSLRRTQKESKNKVKKAMITTDMDIKEKTSLISEKDNVKEISDNVTNKISKLSKEEEMELHENETHSKNELYDIFNDHDCDFNPMKPKHVLPRTPIRDNNLTVSRNTSDTSLSPAIKSLGDITEPQFPICIELNQAQVNWEKHQAQLVVCNKCKRKFHPLRIKKHESCCKRI